jgi:hypothetical protein
MADLPAPLRLRYEEAAFLAGVLSRIDRWEPGAAVRVQRRGSSLGVYAAPPLGCLALVVLPAAEPAGDERAVDEVVSAGRLRDIIGDVSSRRGPDDVREVRLPDAVGPVAGLAVLPPRDGWLPGDHGVAGDVLPRVERAVADFRAQSAASPAQDPATLAAIAEQVWARPGWAGLPLQALHAAVLLGLLPHAGMRVAAATTPGWKRLTTPVGQVFVRSGAPPVLSLAVL